MTLAPNDRPRRRRTASREADKELGTRAHMLIWRSGRTQGEVAEALGIEPTAFGKKLRGKNGWAVQEVIDLAAELDTTVAHLFGEVESPEPDDTTPVGRTGLEPVTDGLWVAPVTPIRKDVA